jgi:cytochrome c oxidase subunit 3
MTFSVFETSGSTAVQAPPRPRLRRRSRPPRRTPPTGPPIDRSGWDEGDHGGGGGDDEPRFEGTPPGAAELALALAIAAITMLFLVILCVWFFLRRNASDWTTADLRPPHGLWIGTALLLASSVTMVHAARAALARPRRRWLAASFGLGILFLTAQGLIWWRLQRGELLPSSNGYGAVFYALTGLHGVHVAGGLGMMGRLLAKPAAAPAGRRAVKLCGVYWHFMGLLWIALFVALYFVR